MKVTLPTQVLLNGISHSAAVAASKSPKPILECVALRADADGRVDLEATDLDVGLRYQLKGADVSQAGSLVVPAARLHSIVREVEEEETTLEDDEGSLRVDTGRSHFRVRGENIEEFVHLPRFPETGAVKIPAALLRNLVRRTVFATAREAGRFALHGVLFSVSASQIEMVATDGRRLARATGTLEAGSTEATAIPGAEHDFRIIIGAKGLALMERLLSSGKNEGEVAIAVEDRQVLFHYGDALIISRLIDGTFPSYEDVIPKTSQYELTMTVADLASGLRRAALLTTRDAMSVELRFDRDILTIRSRAADIGEAKVEVPITYEGPSIAIGFNPQYIQEALKEMDPACEIRFAFTDSKAPATLTDCDEYTYVVMPIALE